MGKRTLVQKRYGALLQGKAAAPDADVHAAAESGVAGRGQALPHLGAIQTSFGHHDVSGIDAHVGGAAAQASEAIGASAYATGNSVAFRDAPDLHTAAHEAAHVVQQRAGVHLKGGVGEVDDPYERHADAVADRVVRGQSAADLLDADAGGAGGAAVQRKWDGAAKSHIDALPKDCDTVKSKWAELLQVLGEYDLVDPSALDPSHLALLAKSQQLIGEICQRLDEAKQTGEPLPTLRLLRTEVDREEDRARYQLQRAGTTGAFKTGAPSYLNITPTQGGKEALSTGKDGKYDESIPVNEQFRATTPEDESKDIDITIDGPGGVIDLLVVSGGHGGNEQLFETARPGTYFSADWWKKQVGILKGKNVRAKLIVLDACLSASLASVFAELLTSDGKLVGYVHSIPQMVVTKDVWKQVHQQGGKEVPKIIDKRLGEVTQEHESSRHGTALEKTVAVAVYDGSRGYLRYDEQALSQTTVDGVGTTTEKSELGTMKRNMVNQGAKGVTGYTPSVTGKEGGTEVVQSNTQKVAMATILSTWWDDCVSKLTSENDVQPGVELYDPQMTETWKVKAVDPSTKEVTLEK